MLRMKFPMMLRMKVLQRIMSSITARTQSLRGEVKDDVVKTVAKIHQRLGHPTRDALVRMLKISGARRTCA